MAPPPARALLPALLAAAAAAERCRDAVRVLGENWRPDWGITVPAAGLRAPHASGGPTTYPHQWCWDTAFIALAHASLNATRAKSELRQLFTGQWANGMLPHIVFNPAVPDTDYFPGPDWWRSSGAAAGLAPSGVETSGITNPPVHTRAVLAIADAGHPEFLEELWPRLDALFAYFHGERTTEVGLVYVRHPWENGMDNSPLWDGPLYKGIPNSSLADLPPYHRTDIHKGVDPRDRPTQAFYDRAVFMLLEARKLGYDEKQMWKAGMPFAVYDSLFNSLVLRGYEDMAEIAKRLGRPADAARFGGWAAALSAAMEAVLWNEDKGSFDDVNALTGERISAMHVSGLMPLVATGKYAASWQRSTARLAETLASEQFCGGCARCWPLPSLSLRDPRFDGRNYWRGPVWVNINWLLAEGLSRRGEHGEAERLRSAIWHLVEAKGMYEYFDPHTGAAHGSGAFSWTAALYYDLFCRPPTVLYS